MRVLAGCESSGVVRRAFAARGHDAWSCDLLPSEDRSNKHIVGDVLDVIEDEWDLLIVAHPPCTILCNSGVKHLYIGGKKENGRNEDRWEELDRAAAFYRAVKTKGRVKRRAIENPVMHGYAIKLTARGRTQFVHPYFFGEPFLKNTGFELINLPELKPTLMLEKPAPGTAEHRKWSACHREPPGPERWKNRSRTYQGIADAMADQWGDFVLQGMFPELLG